MYLKRLRQNEQQYQEILHKKYNLDDLFESRKQEFIEGTPSIANKVAMVEYKESILKRIINKIKRLINTIKR